MTKPLTTERQHEVWAGLCSWVEEVGVTPTAREMMVVIGNKSTNGALEWFKRFECAGLLARRPNAPGQSRQWSVTPAGARLGRIDTIETLQEDVAALEAELRALEPCPL